MREKLGFSYS